MKRGTGTQTKNEVSEEVEGLEESAKPMGTQQPIQLKNLTGKVPIVTGASREIERAIAPKQTVGIAWQDTLL
ncbi:hypothetical protein IQ238_19980 [Pleurocapsales cyanobacterium LEGE 06147]|nr:hypothetical protein [Pleurocapsales cyanobacterium LEGE 06147]